MHGNFAEYVPFALVLLALAELSGAHWAGVHALGLSLLAGRLLHAYGISVKAGVSFGRFWGTALTFAVLLFGGTRAGGCPRASAGGRGVAANGRPPLLARTSERCGCQSWRATSSHRWIGSSTRC